MAFVGRDTALGMLQDSPVLFEGFTSSIAKLYHSGWKIKAEYDMCCCRHLAYLCNKETELTGTICDLDLRQSYLEPLRITRVLPARNVNIQTTIMPNLRTLEPNMRTDIREANFQTLSLWDLLDFEQPQELIVDPDEVQSLLERIVELQRPAQKELRDKNRKTVKKTQAQIISLYEYN